jgi:hypothetical protein
MATSLPANDNRQYAAMDEFANGLNARWCLAFSLASLGGWLWLLTYPA